VSRQHVYEELSGCFGGWRRTIVANARCDSIRSLHARMMALRPKGLSLYRNIPRLANGSIHAHVDVDKMLDNVGVGDEVRGHRTCVDP